jgi:NTP pyrophosphatase (non-canonical NTP hydrolase)
MNDIVAELARAMDKFPTWPTDPLHALAVLGEEFGELSKAMLQLTYEPHKTSQADVREEALQTAAMAVRLAISLDRYQYAACEQHVQYPTDSEVDAHLKNLWSEHRAELWRAVSAGAQGGAA